MENGQDNKLNVKMRWCDSMQSAWWCHLQNRQMVYIYVYTVHVVYIINNCRQVGRWVGSTILYVCKVCCN
jgi:hypothetical protein